MRLKTKWFTGFDGEHITEYRDFIEENQHIEIISVNVLKTGSILLTYKE